jgi:hypothetical protein
MLFICCDGLFRFPVLVFGSWLVVVTFLHHNDEDTPWYTESAWTFVKGNLSSIDRDYGALVNNISHNIHLHQVSSQYNNFVYLTVFCFVFVLRKGAPSVSFFCAALSAGGSDVGFSGGVSGAGARAGAAADASGVLEGAAGLGDDGRQRGKARQTRSV